MYGQQWPMAPPPHMMPPPHPHTPGVQAPPHQPHQPHQHQQPGMPMSPRHPPNNLHPPGTPTLSPAVPSQVPAPSPRLHPSSLGPITSPPLTPASSNGPGAAGGVMDRNAKPCVPARSRVVIKNDAGLEMNIEALKKHSSQGSISGFQSPVVAPNAVYLRTKVSNRLGKVQVRPEKRFSELLHPATEMNQGLSGIQRL